MQPLFAPPDSATTNSEEFNSDMLAGSAPPPGRSEPPPGQARARPLRLQAPAWEAPLHIVPGVPTLVLTGGWEPLYEEIADYLAPRQPCTGSPPAATGPMTLPRAIA